MKFLKQQTGIGIVEALIGSSLIGIAALGMGTAINHMAKAKTKTQVVSNVVALESLVLEGLQSPEQFLPYSVSLKGNDLASFKSNFQISADGWGDGTLKITGPTDFVRYQADGSLCNGCTNWFIQLSLDVVATTTPSGQPSYGFAYNIRTNPEILSIPDLGKTKPFVASSYDIPLPAGILNDEASCDPATEIAASGFNFDSGSIICLARPQQSCPAGEFAVGMVPFPATGNPSRLEYACQRVSNVICPAGYAFRSMNPQLFDVRNTDPITAAKGECVFMGAENWASSLGVQNSPPNVNVTSISGQFCLGSSYRIGSISCQGFVAANSMTSPGTQCPTNYPHGPCPALQAGAWFGAPTSWSGALVSPYIPPQLAIGTVSPDGNTASCVLNNTVPQVGGAGWTGYVTLSAQCVFDPTRRARTILPTLVSGP